MNQPLPLYEVEEISLEEVEIGAPDGEALEEDFRAANILLLPVPVRYPADPED